MLLQMIDLSKLPQLLLKKTTDKNKPKHVILNLYPIVTTEDTNKAGYQRLLTNVLSIIDTQIENNIPILTISLGKKENINENVLFGEMDKFIEKANEHKINVTIFGKWYDLKGQLVEQLKKLNSDTKEFDHFFLNFCINYDGKEEIKDASRVIVKKAIMDKKDDEVTIDLIKENIYSSFLLPPDLVIEPDTTFRGTFLWDSYNTKIFQLNKPVLDITKADVSKAIEKYSQ